MILILISFNKNMYKIANYRRNLKYLYIPPPDLPSLLICRQIESEGKSGGGQLLCCPPPKHNYSHLQPLQASFIRITIISYI